MKEDFPSEFLVPTGVSGRIDKVSLIISLQLADLLSRVQ